MPEQMIDKDTELMLAFKAGDENAFKLLVEKYSPQIFNFAYRFTFNRGDAEDIAQETFLRVHGSASHYLPSAKFSTWLYMIASNLSLDYLKKRKHNPAWAARPVQGQTSEEDGRHIDIEDKASITPEKYASEKAVSEKVNAALSKLPENQRLALTLKVYEDRPYQEIAEILECSVSSVESLIFRARQNLKNILKPE